MPPVSRPLSEASEMTQMAVSTARMRVAIARFLERKNVVSPPAARQHTLSVVLIGKVDELL